MRLKLIIEVPSSAEQWLVKEMLESAALLGQGITITTATGYAVDVDVRQVQQAVKPALPPELEAVTDG